MKLYLNPKKVIIIVISLMVIASIAYILIPKEAELPRMTVQEKKARFKSIIIPAVNKVYVDLMTQYKDTQSILEKGQTNNKIKKLFIEYKATTNEELLRALKPHPQSIAIAQAAIESSWATSRFSRKANNIFGVWSFDKDEPRIAALKKRGNKTIWVKKYASVEASVYDYYRTLGRSSAFVAFRKARMITNDPFLLVTKLDRYSEKGSVYGEELTSIIKYNKFYDYDK